MERKYCNYILNTLALSICIQIAGTAYILGELDDLDTSLEATNQEINLLRENQTLAVEDVGTKTDMIELSLVEQEIAETNEFTLPLCDTSFKCYMDYRAITDETSKQYEIQQQAYTDNDGFRKIGEDYLVAVGTYYSESCGERFNVTLDTGNQITVTIGDIKQDCCTDELNMYSPVYDENGNFISGNVVEFIVDTELLSQKAKMLGSVEAYEDFKGNIKSIERIE